MQITGSLCDIAGVYAYKSFAFAANPTGCLQIEDLQAKRSKQPFDLLAYKPLACKPYGLPANRRFASEAEQASKRQCEQSCARLRVCKQGVGFVRGFVRAANLWLLSKAEQASKGLIDLRPGMCSVLPGASFAIHPIVGRKTFNTIIKRNKCSLIDFIARKTLGFCALPRVPIEFLNITECTEGWAIWPNL